MNLEEFIACHKGRDVRTADLLRTIAGELRHIATRLDRGTVHEKCRRLAGRIDGLVATLEPQRREAAE
jgi:hypothetical protein